LNGGHLNIIFKPGSFFIYLANDGGFNKLLITLLNCFFHFVAKKNRLLTNFRKSEVLFYG